MIDIKIVIASYTPYLKDVDDAILKKYLCNEGADVDIVSWDDSNYNWNSADAVIIRSTWDYHQHLPEYIEWLNMLKRESLLVFNDVDIILGNIFKDKQIMWMQEHSIPCLASRVFSLSNPDMCVPEETLLSTLTKHFPEYCGNSMFVIKPTVSARSYNTHLVDPFGINEDSEAHITSDCDGIFHKMLNKFIDRGIIIQVYAPGIANGEYGLVFLNHTLIQAVRKKPGIIQGKKEKDSAETLPQNVIDLANQVMSLYTVMCSYRRVNILQLLIIEMQCL